MYGGGGATDVVELYPAHFLLLFALFHREPVFFFGLGPNPRSDGWEALSADAYFCLFALLFWKVCSFSLRYLGMCGVFFATSSVVFGKALHKRLMGGATDASKPFPAFSDAPCSRRRSEGFPQPSAAVRSRSRCGDKAVPFGKAQNLRFRCFAERALRCFACNACASACARVILLVLPCNRLGLVSLKVGQNRSKSFWRRNPVLFLETLQRVKVGLHGMRNAWSLFDLSQANFSWQVQSFRALFKFHGRRSTLELFSRLRGRRSTLEPEYRFRGSLAGSFRDRRGTSEVAGTRLQACRLACTFRGGRISKTLGACGDVFGRCSAGDFCQGHL